MSIPKFRPALLSLLLTALPASALAEGPLAAVRSYAYQLTSIRLQPLRDSDFDLFILDYSRDGSEAGRLTREDLDSLRRRGKGRVLLAYLSIGEAESYRYYWDRRWSETSTGSEATAAPVWLGPENPKWHRNYKVKYWKPEWQALVLGYLDKIIDAGFDGVYLDIIDAYEFWGPGGESGLERRSAAQEMIDFVKKIAHHARIERGHKDFAVVPQNGEELARRPGYLEVVSGIGKEDLFYDDNRPQPSGATEEALGCLDLFRQAGKPVLVVDYVTRPQLVREFYKKARVRGYIPYATVRALNVLSKGLPPGD